MKKIFLTLALLVCSVTLFSQEITFKSLVHTIADQKSNSFQGQLTTNDFVMIPSLDTDGYTTEHWSFRENRETKFSEISVMIYLKNEQYNTIQIKTVSFDDISQRHSIYKYLKANILGSCEYIGTYKTEGVLSWYVARYRHKKGVIFEISTVDVDYYTAWLIEAIKPGCEMKVEF